MVSSSISESGGEDWRGSRGCRDTSSSSSVKRDPRFLCYISPSLRHEGPKFRMRGSAPFPFPVLLMFFGSGWLDSYISLWKGDWRSEFIMWLPVEYLLFPVLSEQLCEGWANQMERLLEITQLRTYGRRSPPPLDSAEELDWSDYKSSAGNLGSWSKVEPVVFVRDPYINRCFLSKCTRHAGHWQLGETHLDLQRSCLISDYL